MNKLSKSPKVNRASTNVGVMDIKTRQAAFFAAKLSFVSQGQTMNKTGFAGAVGAENQGDGFQGDALGISERFEVTYMQGAKSAAHQLIP